MIHFKLNDRFIIIIVSSYTDHDHVLVERCQSFNSVSQNWEFFDLNLVQHQYYTIFSKYTDQTSRQDGRRDSSFENRSIIGVLKL